MVLFCLFIIKNFDYFLLGVINTEYYFVHPIKKSILDIIHNLCYTPDIFKEIIAYRIGLYIIIKLNGKRSCSLCKNTLKLDGCKIVIILIVFVVISKWFLRPIQDNSLQIDK